MRIKKYENKWMVWKNITNIFSLAVTQQYLGAFQKPHPVLRSWIYSLYFVDKIIWNENKNEK